MNSLEFDSTERQPELEGLRLSLRTKVPWDILLIHDAKPSNVWTRSTLSAADAESLPPLPDSELGLDAVTVSNVLFEILGQSGVSPNRDSVGRFSGAYLQSLPLGYRRPVHPNKRKRRSLCKHSGSRSFAGDSPKLPWEKPDGNCRKLRE